MQPRPAADEGCLRNWKLHTNANLRSRCWCPLSFSASQEQRADSSPYFASGELCHNSWRAVSDTVYFQHLLAYRTLAQSCSVWDLINGTLVGLLTDSRHFSPISIYERNVESTVTRRPNARIRGTSLHLWHRPTIRNTRLVWSSTAYTYKLFLKRK